MSPGTSPSTGTDTSLGTEQNPSANPDGSTDDDGEDRPTPTRPVGQTYHAPEVPPPPATPGGALVLDEEEGGFFELDEEGVQLGKWHFDEEESVWIFEELTLLGDYAPYIGGGSTAIDANLLPKTGGITIQSLLLAFMSVALIGIAALLLSNREKTTDAER